MKFPSKGNATPSNAHSFPFAFSASRIGAAMLLEIITRREVSSPQSNLFDCAKGRPFNGSIAEDPSMFEAIALFLVVLSVGILVAHALDAFRHRT
jgi:hypothetical protein